jgi:hypothetical protein
MWWCWLPVRRASERSGGRTAEHTQIDRHDQMLLTLEVLGESPVECGHGAVGHVRADAEAAHVKVADHEARPFWYVSHDDVERWRTKAAHWYRLPPPGTPRRPWQAIID